LNHQSFLKKKTKKRYKILPVPLLLLAFSLPSIFKFRVLTESNPGILGESEIC
jgi:hypothetical protein